MHPRVLEVTRRIQARSAATRQRYLEMVRAAASKVHRREDSSILRVSMTPCRYEDTSHPGTSISISLVSGL